MNTLLDQFSMNAAAWAALDPLSEQEKQLRIDLATAYQLAYLKNWDDGIYTHISTSIPGVDGGY
jgi:hypothetical protein